jgi:hypothetical protein
MTLTLHCECGRRLEVTEQEAREFTWCPDCKKVLIMPGQHLSGRQNLIARQPAAAPSASSGSSSRTSGSQGWAGGIGLLVVAAIFGLRALLSGTSSERPNSYPNYPGLNVKPPPVQVREQPGWEDNRAPGRPANEPPRFNPPNPNGPRVNPPGINRPWNPPAVKPPELPRPGNPPGFVPPGANRPGNPPGAPPGIPPRPGGRSP